MYLLLLCGLIQFVASIFSQSTFPSNRELVMSSIVVMSTNVVMSTIVVISTMTPIPTCTTVIFNKSMIVQELFAVRGLNCMVYDSFLLLLNNYVISCYLFNFLAILLHVYFLTTEHKSKDIMHSNDYIIH